MATAPALRAGRRPGKRGVLRAGGSTAYRRHRASPSFGLSPPIPGQGNWGGVRLSGVSCFGSTMPDRQHAGTRDTLTSTQISGKQAIGNGIQAASNRGLLPEAGRTPPGRMAGTLNPDGGRSRRDTREQRGSGQEFLPTSHGRRPLRQGRSVRQNQADELARQVSPEPHLELVESEPIPA